MYIVVCLFMLSEVMEQEFAREIHINPLLTKPFSIIIPAYNEEKRLKPVLAELCTFIETNNIPWNVIVSIDGNDRTENLVRTMMINFSFLDYLKGTGRSGKGRSIKKALNLASVEFVMLMDADGAVALKDMVKYIGLLEMFDFINFDRYSFLGNRIPLARRVASRGFNVLVRAMLGVRVNDTQCGYKIMKTEYAKKAFRKISITNTFFDVALIFYLKKMGARIMEIPVGYNHDGDSKFNVFSEIIGQGSSLLAFRIRNSRFYRYVPRRLVDLYYRKFRWI